MGLGSNIKSFLTGISVNEDAAKDASNELRKIAEKVDTDLKSVTSAIETLNKLIANMDVKISPTEIEGVFKETSRAIGAIADKLDEKVTITEKYKTYSIGEHVLATTGMAGAKVLEGILSVGEELGDGAMALAGWVAPKGSALEKKCTKMIKANWSHDAFNGFYESELAKASAFTEDSFLAGAFKFVGKTATYLAAGGALAGLGTGVESGVGSAASWLAGRGNGIASAIGTGLGAANSAIGTGLSYLGSATTLGATVVGGLAGMGVGTEAGLREGKTLDQAASSDGAKSALIGGGLAFAGGKIHEFAQMKAAPGKAAEALKDAESAVNSASDKVDDVANSLKEAESKLAKYEEVKDAYDDLVDARPEGFWEHLAEGKDRLIGKVTGKTSDAALAKENLINAIDDATPDKVITEKNYKEALTAIMKDHSKAQNEVTKYFNDLAEATTKLDDAKAAAQTAADALDKAKNVKWYNAGGSYEGYTDAITNIGKHPVKAITQQAKNLGTSIAGISPSGIKTTITSIPQNAKNGVVTAAKTVFSKEGAKNLIKGTVAVPVTAVKTIAPVVKTVAPIAPQVINAGRNQVTETGSVMGTIDNTKAYNAYSADSTIKPKVNFVTPDKAEKTDPALTKQYEIKGQKALAEAAENNSTTEEVNEDTNISNLTDTITDTNSDGILDQNTQIPSDSETETPTGGSFSGSSSGGSSGGYSGGSSGGYSGGSSGGSSGGYSGGSGGTPNYQSYTQPTPQPTPQPTTPSQESKDDITVIQPKYSDKVSKDKQSTTQPSNSTKTPETTIVTPATEQSTTISSNPPSETSNQQTWHTGGSYTASNGYTQSIAEPSGQTSNPSEITTDNTDTNNTIASTTENNLGDLVGDTTTSIDDIIKGKKYTKIPTSSAPIKTQQAKNSGGSAVIPIAAGLSAAAAAGIGAKAYIDRKNNSDNGDEEEYENDNWEDEDINSNYDDSDITEDKLTSEDELTPVDAYEVEKYGARSNDELADLQ